MNLDDYQQRLTAALPNLPADERQAVVEEVMSHLDQQVADLVSHGKAHADAVAEAIHRFGSPDEIAAGYDAGSGEVRPPAGDVVLRVAKATGRGAGQAAAFVGRGIGGVARFVAIIVLVSLVVAGGVAVTAVALADEWLPFVEARIEENADHDLYHRSLVGIVDRNDTFYAPSDISRISLSVWTYDATGCFDITIRDPQGTAVHTATVCDDSSLSTTLPPVTGMWTIDYDAGDFAGRGTVRASFTR